MVVSKGLRQAYDMQDFAYAVSMAIKESLTREGKVLPPDKDTAAMISSLNKAWRDAQEQVRIHRGKPLPGSLTHEKVKVGRKQRALSGSLSSLLADSGYGPEPCPPEVWAAPAPAPTAAEQQPEQPEQQPDSPA